MLDSLIWLLYAPLYPNLNPLDFGARVLTCAYKREAHEPLRLAARLRSNRAFLRADSFGPCPKFFEPE